MKILLTSIFFLSLLSVSFADDFDVCGVGEFSSFDPETQITTCIPCVAGRFQDEPGQTACKDCPEGTFQDQPGAAACKRCPAGTFQDETRATECKVCPPGTTSLEGSITCFPTDDVPAMNIWGLLILGLSVLGAALFLLRRQIQPRA